MSCIDTNNYKTRNTKDELPLEFREDKLEALGKVLGNINAGLLVIKQRKSRRKKIKGWRNSVRKAKVGTKIMEQQTLPF